MVFVTGKILSVARMIFRGVDMIFPVAEKISFFATKILRIVSMDFSLSDRLVSIMENIASLPQKIFDKTLPMLSDREKILGRAQIVFSVSM